LLNGISSNFRPIYLRKFSLADWFTIAKEKGLLVQISPDEINDELKALE